VIESISTIRPRDALFTSFFSMLPPSIAARHHRL
jgi:hypothetical protein